MGGFMSMGGDMFGQPGAQNATATTSIAANAESYSVDSFEVVAEFSLPPHWHAYYENPGTVGLPMTAEMPAVKGFKIEGPFFITPQRFESELGVSYGFENPKVGFRITPESNAPSNAQFVINATLQMCRDGECMPPQDFALEIALNKGDGARRANADALTAGIVGLDVPAWAKGLEFSCSSKGDDIILNIAAETALPEGDVYFFSSNGEIMPPSPQVLTRKDDKTWSLAMKRNLNQDAIYPNSTFEEGEKAPAVERLTGVLVVGKEAVAVDAKAGQTSATATAANETAPIAGAENQQEEAMGLLMIIISLFVGGLILNLMPCVFPVIGLKILSFVELGGGERRKVMTHSLLFVLGVLVSFWAITVILVVLKASLAGSGQVVNWAFWMSQPWVIFGLLVLFLLLGLSMYGVFEIGVRATGAGAELQHKKGYAGSFWSGILATVVATPCSAPLLGPALSAALALPTWGIFLALTFMGLGMALPYLVLSASPSMLKYLPKPGAWMESFKQGLSFLLFGAVAWLLWVYVAFFESDNALLKITVGLVLIAAACWIYGRWCPIYKAKKTRIIAMVVTFIIAALGMFWSMPERAPEANEDPFDQPAALVWEDWSLEAQRKALEEGRPVYIDFTAKWCLTCQANKGIAYTQPVIDLVAKYDILMLKADKTRPNAAIDAAMKELGRTSVPVNVLHVPGDPTPHITSELLTEGYLENFFTEKLESSNKE